MQQRHRTLFLLALLIPCCLTAWRTDGDFPALHHAAQLVHTDPASAYPGPGHAGNFTAGPLALTLLQPLALLPYPAAKAVWIALQTLTFLLFWSFLAMLYPILWTVTVRWGWLVVWAISIQPIHNNFQMSGLLLMIATALLVAETLSYSHSPVGQALGGALCGATVAIKVFPLFLAVFYFINKGRAARVGIVAGLLAAVGIPFLRFGIPDAVAMYTSYGQTLLKPELGSLPETVSLPAFLLRLMPAEAANAAGPWIARAAVVLISGVFFLYVWSQSGAKGELKGRNETHLWALAMALMALLNPGTRSYYFIFLVPAFASLIEISYRELSSRVGAAGLVSAFLLLAVSAQAIVGRPVNLMLDVWGIPTLGMILLCAALGWAVNRGRAMYI